MQRKFPSLFSPLKVGGVTLKNRIISAPMTYPLLTSDGCLTPEAIAFYELRAKGGAAVVTVSEVIVDSGTGKYYDVQVVLDAPNAKDSLAQAARAIKRHGAIPSIELSHGGKYALTGGPALGPSDDYENGKMTARAMTAADIEKLLDAYGRAARLCKEAGFEMLLIHAGHGWLLQQFLSPAANHRTDGYGGSLPNRARLALEVIDRVRAAVGPGFPLELRISAQEYLDGGYSMADITEFAKLVDGRIDLLQVSTGAHHGSFDKTHPSMFMARGVNVHFAAEIKKHVKIPVAAIGALNEPGMMDDIIKSGDADVVEMARALLADPFLPRKAWAGRDDEIVRCCRCFTCMAERLATGLRICALNPVIGSEYELSFAAAPTTPKRVLVAGGGPGGMQAALTAAERGHRVVLCEKSGALGGALKSEQGIPFKADLYGFIAAKARQLEKAGVEVRLNTEVTPALAEELSPDALIVAVGAAPIVPPIPGIEGDNVIVAGDLYKNREKVGKRVAVLGGGLVGCETAVHLAREGRDVTVVEMLPDVCLDANGRHRPLLVAELNKSVACRTGLRGVRVTKDGLVCADGDGNEVTLEADTVVVAVGQRPLRPVADALRDCAPEVFEVGDCVKPAQVTQAVFRGHFAALDI
ncbi:2,4-dienoyl-CoA reductase [Sporobacter termitidis DSM 10068]|uniref:2,4-dienoyl-CoA reductase n=1 Tax=Sporobacter termitidis DSM 10068 TaxID=1123282 RepID=A0A1M5YDA2_9FIRM|nr:FAD-dependent oxidoreductase [Sporobacter termitidis]SHI10025.1 2,4-dienoyl-CoA reductase [Sporobacter termitidis DSM 10068]